MKRLIGIILSLIIVISCTTPISVQAKVIEPELVKSDEWVCSYYVDAPEPISNLTGEYPYLACRCDIYSDGTLEFYCWNTHEWDSFVYDPDVSVMPLFEDPRYGIVTDKNFTDTAQKILLSKDVMQYDEDGNILYDRRYDNMKDIEDIIAKYIKPDESKPITFEPFISGTVSLVKEIRDFEIRGSCNYNNVGLSSINGYTVNNIIVNNNYRKFDEEDQESIVNAKSPYQRDYTKYIYIDADYVDSNGVLKTLNGSVDLFYHNLYTCPVYSGKIGNMPFGENEYFIRYSLYPKVYPKDPITITLAGKSITITPEILGSKYENVHTDSPDTVYVKYLESYVSSLEQELRTVTTSTETVEQKTNSFGDINGDNLVDVADAQMILNYYVYTLVASDPEPLEEWISKQ